MNHDGPWTDPEPPTQRPGRGQSLDGGHAHVTPFVAAVGFSDPIRAGSAVRATRAGRARFRRLGTLRSLRNNPSAPTGGQIGTRAATTAAARQSKVNKHRY